MQLAPFWWITLSFKEKLEVVIGAGLLVGAAIILSITTLRPTPVACFQARADFLASENEINEATPLPQEERCAAYRKRLALLTKIQHELLYCFPSYQSGEGNDHQLYLPSQVNFYTHLIETKCRE